MSEKICIDLVCCEKYKIFKDRTINAEDIDSSFGNLNMISEREKQYFDSIRFSSQQRDLKYKRSIYYKEVRKSENAKNNFGYMDIAAMNKAYKKTDFSALKTMVLKSKMAELIGYEPIHEEIIVANILSSPRVCLRLAQETFAKETDTINQIHLISVLRTAIETDNQGGAFVLSKKERKKYWEEVFPEFPVETRETRKWLEIRLFNTSLICEHIQRKIEGGKEADDVKGKEQRWHIVGNEEYEIDTLCIKEYLSDLIAFLHCENKYNPMMPVKRLDLNARLKASEEKNIQEDRYLSENEKEVMRVCKNLLNYQKAIQRERNIDDQKMTENYFSFVLDYLKYLGEAEVTLLPNLSLLNLHLFEDVFGFCYIVEIADYIETKDRYSENRFTVVERHRLFGLLARVFQKLDSETRIEFSKYIIDRVYEAKNKKKIYQKMNDLLENYLLYIDSKESKNGAEYGENVWNKNWKIRIVTLDKLYELIKSEAEFMMPYYKVFAILGDCDNATRKNAKSIRECLKAEVDCEGVRRIEQQVKKILTNMNLQPKQEGAFDALPMLVSTLTFRCWEYCGIEVYD